MSVYSIYEEKTACRILVGKPEQNRLIGRPEHRRVDIKKDLQEV
jgi:hypothetical protein